MGRGHNSPAMQVIVGTSSKFAPRRSHLCHRVGEAGRGSLARRHASAVLCGNRNSHPFCADPRFPCGAPAQNLRVSFQARSGARRQIIGKPTGTDKFRCIESKIVSQDQKLSGWTLEWAPNREVDHAICEQPRWHGSCFSEPAPQGGLTSTQQRPGVDTGVFRRNGRKPSHF